MSVTASIDEVAMTSFSVRLTGTTSEQVAVTLHLPGGGLDARNVQFTPAPAMLWAGVRFENLEPATTYRVNIESESSGLQELSAKTLESV